MHKKNGYVSYLDLSGKPRYSGCLSPGEGDKCTCRLKREGLFKMAAVLNDRAWLGPTSSQIAGSHLLRNINNIQGQEGSCQGQISEHIPADGGYCIYCHSILFAQGKFWKLGNIIRDSPLSAGAICSFWGHMQSHDAFRPIARERK